MLGQFREEPKHVQKPTIQKPTVQKPEVSSEQEAYELLGTERTPFLRASPDLRGESATPDPEEAQQSEAAHEAVDISPESEPSHESDVVQEEAAGVGGTGAFETVSHEESRRRQARTGGGGSGRGGGTGPPSGSGFAEEGGLSGLMNQVLTQRTAPQLKSAGPAARQFSADLDVAESQWRLSGLFWLCYTGTRSYARTLTTLAGHSAPVKEIIVAHADGSRFDLLVLFDQLDEVRGVSEVEVNPTELTSRIPVVMAAARGLVEHLSDVDAASLIGQAVVESARYAEFGLIVAPTPRWEPMSGGWKGHTPLPALIVTTADNTPTVLSTVGIVRPRKKGGFYATTALHAMKGHTDVLIGDYPAKVVKRLKSMDTCVLRVTEPAVLDWRKAGYGGPLQKVQPGRGTRVIFWGAATGERRTVVDSCDTSVLNDNPYLSSSIYTDPVTSPGDSGAALVDLDERVLGFACYRSALDDPVQCAEWVWAAKVLDQEGLWP